jgi:dGTPase
MPSEELYDQTLAEAIVQALRCDEIDINGLLARLKGAQQQCVMPVLRTLLERKQVQQKGTHYTLPSPPPRPDWATTRARVIDLLSSLPPGNPLCGQWWFNFDSAVFLAERIWQEHWGSPVAFLGTPVAGFAYAIATRQPCTIFDIDPDVLSVVEEKVASVEYTGVTPTGIAVKPHNAFEEVASAYQNQFAAVVCDPPWYESYFHAFLKSCLELGRAKSFAYWSLAPLLTRAEAERQRIDFLNELAGIGCAILTLDSAALTYVIPEFEVEAYRHIPGFHNKVWRRGDLLCFRLPDDRLKSTKQLPNLDPPACLRAVSYWNRKSGIRLFHLPLRERGDGSALAFEEDSEFAHTVSMSSSSWEHIAIWSSQKKGFRLSQIYPLPNALGLWRDGNSLQQIREALEQTSSYAADEVSSTISLLEEIAESREKEKVIRRHEDLRRIEADSINEKWATLESSRERETQPDPYRLEFQRDRDKILWSKWFKRLASKTQVFPTFGDDRFRSRLTHTLEVAQIARTVSRAFGLSEDLTEAIALAHDIGHTPFGHAGEEAINDFMRRVIHSSCKKVERQRTTWFSHYEHGVDVLRWLEDIYFSPGAGRAPGLGVSMEIYDGVFKHMYHRSADRGRKSQGELYGYSKHQDVIREGAACLEGQTVRIADKICCLVQDIEDGILAGILSVGDLSHCRLFSRPYVDLALAPGETEHRRYLSQRAEIINILTKDVLENTQTLLRQLKGREEISQCKYYLVCPSDEIAEDMREVWVELQAGILHKHPRVVGANARASRIVNTLLMLFMFCPDLVDLNFREYFKFLETSTPYVKAYEDAVGTNLISIGKEAGGYFDAGLARDSAIEPNGYAYRLPLRNLILAKDYVAFLTDGQAMQIYNTCGQAAETFGVE